MYLYFNNQGVLKEIVNDEAIRQGNSNINKIRFFIEGAEPQVVNNVYKAITFITGVRTFIDVEGNQLTTESVSLSTEELEIPYNKKRELKFFKYFTKYEMFSITIPDDILNENGTVGCRIQMVSAEGIITLGLIVFNVEITTGGQAIIEPDTAINIAQWNYLIANMLTPEKYVIKYNSDASEWDVVPTEGSTKPVTSGGVATAIANALSTVYKLQGSAEASYLEGLTKSEAMNGYVYNLSNDGTLTNEDSTTISVQEGDNVVFIWNEGEWYWDKIGSSIDTSDLATKTGNNTFSGNNTFGGVTSFVGLISGDFVPSGNGTKDIGASDHKWKDLYLGGKVDFGTKIVGRTDTVYIDTDNYDGLRFYINNTNALTIYDNGIYAKVNVIPNTTNTYNLGSNDKIWKDLYLGGKIDFGNNATITKDSSNRVNINNGGEAKLKIGASETICKGNFSPDQGDTYNLGRSGLKWNYVYTNYISDGTTIVIPISDIATKVDTTETIDLGTFDANGEITYDITTLQQDLSHLGYDNVIHGMYMLTYLYAQAIIYLDETQLTTAANNGFPVRAPMPVVYNALSGYSVPGNVRVQKVGTNLVFKVSDGSQNAAQGQHMYLIPTNLIK